MRHSLQRIYLLVSCVAFSFTCAGASTLSPDTIKRSHKNTTLNDSSYYVSVNRVLIIGNKHTKNTIIARELMLKPGDVVWFADLPNIIEKDKRKLFNLHLFHVVNIRVLDLENGTIDLLVEVEERWYVFPIPIFRLSDRNFNEWWENYNHDFDRVNYGLKWYQYNVWGRNHTLLLTAQFGFQRRFELVYRLPYLNKTQKQGLIVEMDYIDAKNVADSTVNHKLDFMKHNRILRNTKGIGLTYTYRNNFYNHHRIKYEVRQTNIADTLQELNHNYLGDNRTSQTFDALTYQFISDHRDVVFYPLNGRHIDVRLQHSGIALHKDLQKTEAIASFAFYKDLKKNFYLSNLTYGYISTPDNIPYFNYGVMGYNKIFIRGYEVYVIEGPQFFLNKTTLKKRIFSRKWDLGIWPIEQFNYFPLDIYLKTYADFGYINNYTAYSKSDLNTMLSNTWLGGAGAGLDIVTAYDVVIRFEYTFTTQNTNGFFLHIKKEF